MGRYGCVFIPSRMLEDPWIIMQGPAFEGVQCYSLTLVRYTHLGLQVLISKIAWSALKRGLLGSLDQYNIIVHYIPTSSFKVYWKSM